MQPDRVYAWTDILDSRQRIVEEDPLGVRFQLVIVRNPACYRGSGFGRSQRLIESAGSSNRAWWPRAQLFGRFGPLTIAQSHTRAAAVLVDEFHVCRSF